MHPALRLSLCPLLIVLLGLPAMANDFTRWQSLPAKSPPVAVTPDTATLSSGEWSWLTAPVDSANVELSATVTIDGPATQFDFFGSSWSAWPDPKFGDRGFEAGVLLRGARDGSSGYRVQLSTKYQEVALVRFPDGGYVRSVPCVVRTQTPITLRVSVTGAVLRVFVEDQELIRYVDRLEPRLAAGAVGIGASSAARVTWSGLSLRDLPEEPTPPVAPRVPQLSFRKWLGGRTFVFDDHEPILQLHHSADPTMFAKLRPGLKPLLNFDSHWGLENQGAYKEATVTWTEPRVEGSGETLRASWSAKHVQARFVTRSELLVGYDPRRETYTYDITSELEVLPGDPFLFRYGFDFEHHTPLDPFRWQHLLIRDREGRMTRRPLSPFDPGPLDDIETYHGLRVWHGRTGDVHRVSPAVEYEIRPEWVELPDDKGSLLRRKLNTAVCAAFYDTGVAFEPVTARPGDKVRVRYRYTGYPVEETTGLFATARVQENPRIDPRHHFVFLGEHWPTIRFDNALPMDQPWWGGRPLLTGHNARPTYGFAREGGTGLLKLGPVSYGIAPVGPERVEPGRYLVTTRVKSINTHGPGGRIEILTLKKADLAGNGYVRLDPANISGEHVRYFGLGTFDWREVSFVAEVPPGANGLALGLGNAGTGEVQISHVKIEPLGDKPAPSETLAPHPHAETVVRDALWDLRMREGQGLYVYNHGSSSHRVLELANLDWVTEEGRTAIRFVENPPGRRDYPPLGILDQNVRHPVYRQAYEPVSHGAYALGGYHGGGDVLPGLTLAAWIKPASEMGKSHHTGKGDVIGYGARRFILGLQNQTAPYSLVARLNVNDRIESQTSLEAQRWYHVAMTCHPAGEQWGVRLYLDGREVGSGTTKQSPVSSPIPDSLILGAELFYLHDAYFRGLMSDVLVLRRTLDAGAVAALAKR